MKKEIISKEDFEWVWKDSTKEDILNQFYYEHNDLRELLKENGNKEEVITQLTNQLKIKNLILKALHKYFTEHEHYEEDEILRELESCTDEDIIWLKRMTGEE